MPDFLLRVLMAALLSFIGVLATYTWSKSQTTKVVLNDARPLARITSISNEVQRRPGDRIIWQQASANQELFAGEGVRTSSDAEATIEFIEKQVTVRLEPDSVIEIEEIDGGINLDFLKGNLFIVSKGNDSGITVQSGEEKVAVGGSELQVSKTTSKSQMDVDVYKGQPKLVTRGESKPVQDRKLKVVRPRPGEMVYVSPESEETVSFEWQPIDPTYEVLLETGDTKLELKRVGAIRSGARLEFPMKVGKHFYRLVARSPNQNLPELTSSISRIEVRAKIPPVLLEPLANAVLKPEKDKAEFVFRWSNPGDLTDLVLEVARTKNLKDEIVVKPLGHELEHKVSLREEAGHIFWRVSGRPAGTQITVSSPVQSFFVQAKGREPIHAPVLKTPVNAHSVPLLEMKSQGVKLTWDPVSSASRYDVTLIKDGDKDSQPIKQSVTATEWTATELLPGPYKWFVVANDQFGQKSPESEVRNFAIESLPVLRWSDGLTESKFLYRTEKPYLKVAWEQGPGSASMWRVRVTTANGPTREPASPEEWKLVQKPELEMTLEQPGTYFLEAEAVDAKGAVVGRTSVRTQEIEQAPPPPAPEFTDAMPAVIQADDNGSVDVAWKAVSEAKEYVLHLKTQSGAVVRTHRFKGTGATLNKVKTGDYSVVLQSVDPIGRTGPESAPRPLHVPEYSEVQAPKLKNVKVR